MEQAERFERRCDDVAAGVENREAMTVGENPGGPSRSERGGQNIKGRTDLEDGLGRLRGRAAACPRAELAASAGPSHRDAGRLSSKRVRGCDPLRRALMKIGR